MKKSATSIRPFIGAKEYVLSRNFYRALGFEEIILSDAMCLFKIDQLGFYLQNAYVKEWIDNTMIFWEVANLTVFRDQVVSLQLPAQFPGVKVSPIQQFDWGRAFYLHDPSGILWHIGQFNNP